MAVAAYYAWDRDGRPLEPARPIRELVGKLRDAFPRAAAANLFSWYADEAHYQADFPEDHTPYSHTPWPLTPNPYPVVFATDVMHRPELGVDCNVLVPYWLAEARAGRMPWLKYLIWQARLYHVSNAWRPVANSGHHDHAHLSARTDHQNTSLGGWSVTPAPTNVEEDDMRMVRTPGGTIYVIDGWNHEANLPYLYPQTNWPKVKEWIDAGVPIKQIDRELTPEHWDQTGPDPEPIVLDDETMAQLLAGTAAAAREGAEAGAPSHDELVAAAREGSEQAEDA